MKYTIKIAGDVETAGLYLKRDIRRGLGNHYWAGEVPTEYASRSAAYTARRIALVNTDRRVRLLVVKIDG